jgi:hypothetical protein
LINPSRQPSSPPGLALRVARTVVAVLAVTLVAAAASAASADVSWREFQSPRQNILCIYGTRGGAHIFCRANDPGIGLSLYVRGAVKKVRLCDPHPPHAAPQLDYGQAWRRGPLRCTSRVEGIRCRSTVSGAGFLLSKSTIVVTPPNCG